MESGLDFRMNFLPGEQGETFKINLYDHGAGLAVSDVDGDGHQDLYLLNQLGANALFRNRGDGTFEDITARSGTALEDRICVGAAFGDYDQDGDPDLFVTSTRGGNVLLKNDGKGHFQDATRDAGVGYVGHSQTGAFLDYDNDGDLDLFVANTAEWTLNQLVPAGHYYAGKGDPKNPLGDMAGSRKEANLLYRNNGDGTFTDVTRRAGVKGGGWSGDVAVLDYDEDGDADLLVSRMFGAAQLFQNQGDGTFQETTRESLGKTSWGGVGTRAFDYDNDGKLDLAILDMHSDMWMGLDRAQQHLWAMVKGERERYRYVLGPRLEWDPEAPAIERQFARAFQVRYEDVLFGNSLFRNRGGGRFEETGLAAGFETMWPWGAATADFDSDGHEDAFVPSGMGYPFVYWPNALLMNSGGRFTNRAKDLGLEPPPGGEVLPEPIAGQPAVRSSRCAVTADFDGDGDLDLVVNNFNDRAFYFRNEFPRRNHIAFRLRGTRCNREAIGAVVRVRMGKDVLTRQLQTTGGYLSQSSHVLHFGLGDRERVDRVEVVWPGGQRQNVPSFRLNQVNEVTQSSA